MKHCSTKRFPPGANCTLLNNNLETAIKPTLHIPQTSVRHALVRGKGHPHALLVWPAPQGPSDMSHPTKTVGSLQTWRCFLQ
ncbi:unnamed protein product [Ixodes persulcatus]